MAWKPIVIDESIANTASGGILRVPEGDYLLQVMKVNPCPEAWVNNPDNADRSPWMQVQFVIKDGPLASGSYTETYSFAPRALFRLGNLLLQAGLPQTSIDGLKGYPLPTWQHFAALATKLESIIGTKVVGAVIVDNLHDPTRPRSQVAEYYPPSDFATRRAPVNGAGGAPRPAAVAAAPVAVAPPVASVDLSGLSVVPAPAASVGPGPVLPNPGPLPVEQHTPVPAESGPVAPADFEATLDQLLPSPDVI